MFNRTHPLTVIHAKFRTFFLHQSSDTTHKKLGAKKKRQLLEGLIFYYTRSMHYLQVMKIN